MSLSPAVAIESEKDEICYSLGLRLKEIAVAKGRDDSLMDTIRGYIALSYDENDIRMLRLFERYLSWEYKPRIIKMVVAALNGDQRGYDPTRTRDSSFSSVTEERLEAYRRIYISTLTTDSSRLALAREAARHPELTDKMVELIGRGYDDYQQIMDTVQSERFWSTATPFQEGVL